jgi:phosphoserine phosphatase SerB
MKIECTGNIHELVQHLNQQDDRNVINFIAYTAINEHAIVELELENPIATQSFSNQKLVVLSRQYVLSCLLPTGSVAEFCSVFSLLPKTITQIRQLSKKNRPLLAFEVHFSMDQDEGELNDHFLRFGQETGIDLCLQPLSVTKNRKRVIIFDMDSTLIQQEVIDELAREAGVYDRVSAVTERAMRGELDFNESLRERVKTLAGQNIDIIEKVKSRIEFMPGARELTRALSKLGIITAVVSGGFLPLANYVKETLGLNYAFANTLLSNQGVLTGSVLDPIVNAERKRDLLSTISQLHGIPRQFTMAVGDGANDLLMLQAAGLGVAFNAKPKVQQKAQVRINQPSLFNVLYLLGITEEEVDELLG